MLTVAGKKPHVYADFHCFCQRRLVAIDGYEDFELIHEDEKTLVEMRCPDCQKLHKMEALKS